MVRAAALDARRSFTGNPCSCCTRDEPVRRSRRRRQSLRRVSCRVRATTTAKNATPPRSHIQVDRPVEAVFSSEFRPSSGPSVAAAPLPAAAAVNVKVPEMGCPSAAVTRQVTVYAPAGPPCRFWLTVVSATLGCTNLHRSLGSGDYDLAAHGQQGLVEGQDHDRRRAADRLLVGRRRRDQFGVCGGRAGWRLPGRPPRLQERGGSAGCEIPRAVARTVWESPRRSSLFRRPEASNSGFPRRMCRSLSSAGAGVIGLHPVCPRRPTAGCIHAAQHLHPGRRGGRDGVLLGRRCGPIPPQGRRRA